MKQVYSQNYFAYMYIHTYILTIKKIKGVVVFCTYLYLNIAKKLHNLLGYKHTHGQTTLKISNNH